MVRGWPGSATRGCRRKLKGSNMADPKPVTQREAYIIAQALYEFIRLEQSKPDELIKRLRDDKGLALG